MTDQLPPSPTVPDRRGHYVATKADGRVWVGSTNGRAKELQERIDRAIYYLTGERSPSWGIVSQVGAALSVLRGP